MGTKAEERNNMEEHSAVVEALYVARSTGSQPSGVDNVKFELDEALQLQLRVSDRFAENNEKIGGWKVGLTSGAARDRMGKDFRPFGYVLRSRILPSDALTQWAKILKCSVEPELCLIIGSPLRGDTVGVAEAKAAVRAVAPAFEINERRTRPEQGNAFLVADGLANWGIVVGPEAPVRDGLVDTTVEFFCDGQLIESKTPGATMDDPYLSLSRLCRLLHRYSRGLEPGQPVITGSFCNQVVKQPGRYHAVFSGIGEVSVRFE
jgi:2-keto-4-pentenoate hydratase